MSQDRTRERIARDARSKYDEHDTDNREIFRKSYRAAHAADHQPRDETVDIEYNMAIFRHAWADPMVRSKHTEVMVGYATYILSSLSHVRWIKEIDGKLRLNTKERVLHADVTKFISFFDAIGFLDTLVTTLKTAQKFDMRSLESEVTMYDANKDKFTVSSCAFQQTVACINIDYKSKGETAKVINFGAKRR